MHDPAPAAPQLLPDVGAPWSLVVLALVGLLVLAAGVAAMLGSRR